MISLISILTNISTNQTQLTTRSVWRLLSKTTDHLLIASTLKKWTFF